MPKEHGGCVARHTHVHVKWIMPNGISKRKGSSNEEKNMNRKKKDTHDYYECSENDEGHSEDIIGRDNSKSSENQQGGNAKDDKRSVAQTIKRSEVRI